MSKKEIVKEVIDKLIDDGYDFADLTQGELVRREELAGVSKTTIKRAKKEYKLEKIVVKEDYKEQAIKRKIYKYLDRHSKSTLSDLREALPNILPAKVSEYHQIWLKKQQKKKKEDKKSKPTVTPRKLREMVFSFLDKTPGTTIDQLILSFPDSNKSSLTSYFGHWKKKQRETESVKEGGLYQVVIRFLDKNPGATIEKLKESFADIPERSLAVYYNLWQKKQVPEEKADHILKKVVEEIISNETADPIETDGSPATLDESKSSAKENTTNNAPSTDTNQAVSSNKLEELLLDSQGSLSKEELIDTLRNTIQAQKSAIDALDAEYTLLKNRQSDILMELENMSKKEIDEIKSFISTYLVGLKK